MNRPICKENRLNFDLRAKFLSLSLMLVLIAGCPPAADDGLQVEVLPEPAWQDLISEVRTNQSDEIQFTSMPVTVEQANELKISCQKLRVLHLDQSDLNNELLAEVLSMLPVLQQLKLAGPVTNDQLETITKYASQLKVLNLPDGQFDDAGLKFLKEIPNLELLRFQSRHVTDQGIPIIGEMPELKSLHLINVPITDESLETIESMKSLQSFYLDGSKCTDEGLSKLIKARPKLHFHWNQMHLQQDPNSHQH